MKDGSVSEFAFAIRCKINNWICICLNWEIETMLNSVTVTSMVAKVVTAHEFENVINSCVGGSTNCLTS